MWGQSEFGGLMISTNARPLDMIKLENPHPLKIPWIGHMKWTLFVSNLGPENTRKYPYFYGLKWSWKPYKLIEFGLSETIITGGEGAPKLKWWEPITEMFPFQKWGGNNIGATDISNHEFGFFDLRVTIPPLRGAQIYYDMMIEDSIVRAFRLPDNFLRQVAFVTGIYFPSLNRRGDLGLRLEYHHIPPVAYRHGNWTSGYTLNRRVIGDALGPTADGIYAKLYWWPTMKMLTDLEIAFERFDSSLFRTETDPVTGGGDRIVKDVDGPKEYRFRIVSGLEFPISKRLDFKTKLGYEFIGNFNFNVGRDVNNVLFSAGLSLKFPEFEITKR